jgi:hypothetical protein
MQERELDAQCFLNAFISLSASTAACASGKKWTKMKPLR